MIKYSVVVTPYSAANFNPNERITINRYLISNVCLSVTKQEWETRWYLEGWRPVEAYGASNEQDFTIGDLIWCKLFGVVNFTTSMPKKLVRKIIFKPSDFGKLTAARLTELLELGESISLAELQKLQLVKA
jgi:hypothetical protein